MCVDICHNRQGATGKPRAGQPPQRRQRAIQVHQRTSVSTPARTQHRVHHSAYLPEPQTLLHRLHPVVKQVGCAGMCTQYIIPSQAWLWALLLLVAGRSNVAARVAVAAGAQRAHHPCYQQPPRRGGRDNRNAAPAPVGAAAAPHAVDLRLCAGCHHPLGGRRSPPTAGPRPRRRHAGPGCPTPCGGRLSLRAAAPGNLYSHPPRGAFTIYRSCCQVACHLVCPAGQAGHHCGFGDVCGPAVGQSRTDDHPTRAAGPCTGQRLEAVQGGTHALCAYTYTCNTGARGAGRGRHDDAAAEPALSVAGL